MVKRCVSSRICISICIALFSRGKRRGSVRRGIKISSFSLARAMSGCLLMPSSARLFMAELSWPRPPSIIIRSGIFPSANLRR
ncbi:MAG: hypothetical protein A2096_11350 [Spirochaetes bacterium GWF1_41_5]|nr:MAG: hypothetical protein A2096_11350 [Spirochaetes bacterium GWF1_41_5]